MANGCAFFLQRVAERLILVFAVARVVVGDVLGEQCSTPNSGSSGQAMLQQRQGSALEEPETPRVDKDPASTVDAVIEAMRLSGAVVHPALRIGEFQHGGSAVRGLFSKEPLTHDKIVEIPRSMWLTELMLPESIGMQMENEAACSSIAIGDSTVVKMAIMLFIESRSTDKSAWKIYLQNMPSLSDLQSFNVVFADQQLENDFAGLLTFMERMRGDRATLDRKLQCLVALTHIVPELSSMTRDEMTHWILIGKTRRYSIDGGRASAMLPVTDLANTANRHLINTQWHDTADGSKFIVNATAAAGEELFEPYCPTCPNDLMLLIWGIYLQDNPNGVDPQSVDCRQLHRATMDTLAFQASGNGQPPNCVSSDMKRCSLARLSLELCRATHGPDGPFSLAASVGINQFNSSKGDIDFRSKLERAAIGIRL